MNEPEFPEKLLQFLRDVAPTFPAVELLVFLMEHPDREWKTAEVFEALRSRGFSSASVAGHFVTFKNKGLIEELPSGGFRCRPSTPELLEAVELLKTAFNERPVSLIRTIYALADHPIQSFADSFRIKDD